MQQLAVVHTEQISRKGEIKYFQIPMPGTSKKIIGVEASAVLFSAVDVPPVQPGDVLENIPVNASANNNNCPNPGKASIEPVEETVTAGADGIRTQVYKIGSAVNPGFIYSCGVYSVVLFVPALDEDSPASIAQKMAAEVNNTSLAVWNQYGSNTKNYKPTAIAVGDLLTLTVDSFHSFFAIGTGECSGPLTPSVVQYDPLFTVRRNEKAGTLSLQSPDATDIFYQCEAYREDKNLAYADFTLSGEMVGEWLKGKKRIATEVSISTESPILEAYYKDTWGNYHGKDLNYQLNIIIWYEKQNL
jgi:hypothetical protein